MEKHPNLKDKFQLLYLLKLNPKVGNNIDLGRMLGTSRQAISRWCTGTRTTRGNEIPLSQTEKVAEIFQIDHDWLSLSFGEFEERVRALIESRKNLKSGTSPEISIAALPITNIELVGREEELSFLDTCWSDPKVNFVEVVAFGGTGKSSLINKWLSGFRQDHYRKAEKIYAWSFYWQGHSSDVNSSGDYFIEHALTWFGDENPTAGTPWSKASRLAKLIRDSRTLLILDGLEPLQFPPGNKHGQIENPSVSFLIRELAAENQGLVIATTRSPVTDIKAFDDGRVAKLNLSNLSEEAGIALLKRQGVTGKTHEYENVVRSYDGHPLSLSLVAGYLTTVHQGDLSNLSEGHSLLDDAHRENQVQGIMSDYLEWLSDKPALQLLRLVSLLERTTSVQELQAVSKIRTECGLNDDLADHNEGVWRYAIQELISAKLVSSESQNPGDVIDCHPLIQDCILQHLKGNEGDMWESGNSLIFDYLISTAPEEPANMTEMEPLFRAVIHGTRARRYTESFALYYEKIKKGQFSIFTDGSHHADQSCIRAFFGEGWDTPTEHLDEESQMFLITSAATNLIYLGHLAEAIEPTEVSIRWFIKNQSYLQAAVAAAPLLSMYIAAGELDAALRLVQGMEDVIHKSENEIAIAMAANFKAYIYYLSGEPEIAQRLFLQAESVLTQPQPQSEALFPTISSYYCKYLLDVGKESEALERSLKTFAWRNRNTWQVAVDTTSIYAGDLLVLGLAFLALGDKVNAQIQLNKQVDLLRSNDEWLYLPSGLNSRAKLHIAMNDLESATKDLQESLEVSKRTGAKFHEWEAYLDLARLNIQRQDFKSATEYLDKARSNPAMRNYRFRDKEIKELENSIDHA